MKIIKYFDADMASFRHNQDEYRQDQDTSQLSILTNAMQGFTITTARLEAEIALKNAEKVKKHRLADC